MTEATQSYEQKREGEKIGGIEGLRGFCAMPLKCSRAYSEVLFLMVMVVI